LDAALGRRQQVDIFGGDYPTADGTAVRDYVHVTDLADAHLKALGYLIDGQHTISINLGGGTGSTVRQVVAATESVVGRKIRTVVRGRREGDPAHLVANPAKAATMLGWRPEHSRLTTMITDAWRWHTARFGRSTTESMGASTI
jgi:UDP-glucose 4-epimerase